ncbi:tetratricopeptide repeat protein, partial [Streptomyces phaeofaciens]
MAAAFQPRIEARESTESARFGESGMVLSGGGGVGKSQLAASLARELRDAERSNGEGLDLLVWAGATDTDQIIAAYAEAANQLKLPGVSSEDVTAAAKEFLRWLASTHRRWLVVLDNITDPQAVMPWWPENKSPNGRVLATTRRSDALLSGHGRTLVRLGLYTQAEARAYLRRRLTDAGYAHLYDSDQAEELATELDLLPLALSHAAAYLINNNCSMSDYLSLLRNAGNNLDDLLPSSADTEGYGLPVTAALLISLNAVAEDDVTRIALPLLRLTSLMDPHGHPAELWTTAPVLNYLGATRRAKRRWLRRSHPVVTQPEIRSALECLRRYSLITQDVSTAPVRMHALTARAVREAIPLVVLRDAARAAADGILSLWPDVDLLDRELSAALRTNTVHLDQHAYPALWLPTTHPCIYRVSSSLTAAGLYHRAVEHDLAIMHRSEDVHGPDHPETFTARNNLAISYRDAGRLQEALALGERVLADYERVLGPDHPATLTARNNLAISYRDAGRLQEALA